MRTYTKIQLTCDNCNSTFERRAALQKYNESCGYKTKFCTGKCLQAYRTRRVQCICAECGKEFGKLPNQCKFLRDFCSRKCSTISKNRTRIGNRHPNWAGGTAYRIYALRVYGEICSSINCDLLLANIDVPESLLDVHHIDSNRKNNAIENLEVLCVWCHAKKTRGVF